MREFFACPQTRPCMRRILLHLTHIPANEKNHTRANGYFKRRRQKKKFPPFVIPYVRRSNDGDNCRYRAVNYRPPCGLSSRWRYSNDVFQTPDRNWFTQATFLGIANTRKTFYSAGSDEFRALYNAVTKIKSVPKLRHGFGSRLGAVLNQFRAALRVECRPAARDPPFLSPEVP